MIPYVVLGTYYPTQWKSWVVGPELCALTRGWGLIPHPDPHHGPLHLKTWYSVKLHAEVRAKTLAGEKAKQGTQWHQDGDLKDGANMACALVTWCDVEPTEFKQGEVIYQPQPYEVVIARNLGCHHRRPPKAPMKRWLFRQRVMVPTHIPLP